MSKYKFVGFQDHIEVPDGYEQLVISEKIEFNCADVYEYLSQPDLLSLWFYKIKSIDVKPSGKVEFEDANISGICISAELGRSITLVSDQFGEFTAKVKGTNLEVEFKILTNNLEVKRVELTSLLNSLKGLIQ